MPNYETKSKKNQRRIFSNSVLKNCNFGKLSFQIMTSGNLANLNAFMVESLVF